MMDSYLRLLSWHAAHVRSIGHVEFGATILRTRSKALHDILAYVATDNKYTISQLKNLVSEGTFHEVEFRNLWLATLGRVIIIQALEEVDSGVRADELDFGLNCLKHANRRLPRNQEHQQFHRLEIELLMKMGEIEEARTLLDNNQFLNNYFHGYLRGDLDHPVISKTVDTYDRWVACFNQPLIEHGLLPIESSPSLEPKFSDLTTVSAPAQTGGPKVSVLMTSYRPDREDFLTAVTSVLNQSWQELELIIIDDASPSEYKPVLAEAEGLDSRVRVIRLKENGGTYRARNAGIAEAKGVFITGQDSDDWSHPERIATQVEYLMENSSAPGVIVEAIRADKTLVRTFPARIPHGPCEVSFMLREELAREIGGYLEVRKGADGEFRRRVEKFTGRKVGRLAKPLYLIQVGHASLSKDDFKPGWSHPARRAFWNSSSHWHENTAASDVRLSAKNQHPMPVPNSFEINPPVQTPQYDVVFIGDWRAYASTQRAMLDEIAIIKRWGKKVGILHQDSIISPVRGTTRLNHQVQRMINAADIHEVMPDENAQASLLIIHDPTIIQFMPEEGINLTSELVLIKPDMPPDSGRESDALYLPDFCDRKAGTLFQSEKVVWTASDPEVLRYLQRFEYAIEVDQTPAPVAFCPQTWFNTRTKLCESGPIIGRHSANYEEMWPEPWALASKLWPMQEGPEVRILGDARSFLRKYELARYPLNWVVFREGEIHPQAFMSAVDFFVYYPDERYPQAFSREALEAAASGALVVLPFRFHEVHQNAAVYAESENVPSILEQYVNDRSMYKKRREIVRNFFEGCVFEDRFIDYIRNLAKRFNLCHSTKSESHA